MTAIPYPSCSALSFNEQGKCVIFTASFCLSTFEMVILLLLAIKVLFDSVPTRFRQLFCLVTTMTSAATSGTIIALCMVDSSRHKCTDQGGSLSTTFLSLRLPSICLKNVVIYYYDKVINRFGFWGWLRSLRLQFTPCMTSYDFLLFVNSRFAPSELRIGWCPHLLPSDSISWTIAFGQGMKLKVASSTTGANGFDPT